MVNKKPRMSIKDIIEVVSEGYGPESHKEDIQVILDDLNQKVQHLVLRDLVREFLKILNKVEVSDSGNEFRPNTIRSCRVMDTKRLGEILREMEEVVEE